MDEYLTSYANSTFENLKARAADPTSLKNSVTIFCGLLKGLAGVSESCPAPVKPEAAKVAEPKPAKPKPPSPVKKR